MSLPFGARTAVRVSLVVQENVDVWLASGGPAPGIPHSLSAPPANRLYYQMTWKGQPTHKAIHLPDAGEGEEGEGGLAILRACAPWRG